MLIESTANASTVLDLYRTKAASGGASSAQSATTTAESASSADGVTSTVSSSCLESGTLGETIAQGQDVDGEAVTADTSPLPTAVETMLAQIASDPAYAAEQAEQIAHGTPAVFMTPPPNGFSMSVMQEFFATVESALKQLEDFQSQKQALYDSLSAQGTPPAEIYAQMLEIEASQPESYWNALDPAGELGDLQGNRQAQLTQLRQDMAAASEAASV